MKFYLVASKPRAWWNILSPVIMKSQQLKYSHVSILVDINGIGAEMFEAVYPKSRCIQFKDWCNGHSVVQTREIKIEDHNAAYGWLLLQKDKQYSMAQLFLILIKKFINKIGFVKLNNDRFLICSELCGMFISKYSNYAFANNEDQIDLIDMDSYFKA